jgi:hypothetical protein
MFPGCTILHDEHHKKGEDWVNRKYNISLFGICRWFHREYLKDVEFMPSEPELWDEAPSGPLTEGIDQKKKEKYEQYLEWRRSPSGQDAFQCMVDQCLDLASQNRARIGVKFVLEHARTKLRTQINNTFQPWIARDILVRHPELKPLIELRGIKEPV